MGDLQSSLLTGTQRDVLAGEAEPSRPRELKSRLRKRVYTGLKADGHLLLEGLSRDERRKLFRAWEMDPADGELDNLPGTRRLTGAIARHGPNPETTKEKEDVEREEFKEGITDLLAFLYLGIEDGNVGEFEEILESAITRAAHKSDRSVSEFDLDIELSGTHVLTPEAIAERVREDDLELTLQEVIFAYNKGALTQDEVEEYLEPIDADGLLSGADPSEDSDGEE